MSHQFIPRRIRVPMNNLVNWLIDCYIGMCYPFDLMLSCQSVDSKLGIPYNYSLLVLFGIKFLGRLKIAFGWNGVP